jgi:hypothetical protein
LLQRRYFHHPRSDAYIGSISARGHFVRLFNPRTDDWHTHFILRETMIEALTEIGEVTVNILQFNHPERLLERKILISERRYPGRLQGV